MDETSKCYSLEYLCDANVSDIDDYDYRPDNPLGRASQDSVCNPRRTKMLDLCKSLSLRIANGRLGHDFNKGELTYFSQHSQSIIDYLVLKESDFSLIHDYCISDINSHSDHAPLYFTIFGRSVVYIEWNVCLSVWKPVSCTWWSITSLESGS